MIKMDWKYTWSVKLRVHTKWTSPSVFMKPVQINHRARLTHTSAPHRVQNFSNILDLSHTWNWQTVQKYIKSSFKWSPV